MLNRKELPGLVIAAIIGVVILIGFIVIDTGPGADEGIVPEEHSIEADAPEDVQETPPSATGDIDEP